MSTNTITRLENYPLKEHTTLKIGGNADEAYIPGKVEDIYAIKENVIDEGGITVVGKGSNLLISSKGVREKAILTENLKNYEFIDETTLKVESGLKSSSIAKLLLEKNLSGLEFLIGIPGSIGGAITMNSSAHGQAIEDVIESAQVIDLHTNQLQTMSKGDLQLSYRNSFIEKNRHFILSAVFNLKKDDHKAIEDRINFHLEYRQRCHPPYNQPNAGSTFRNPEPDVYVGQLLEQLGAKGWKEGGAAISDMHCNFIVNTGNASSLDVSRLMHRMHSSVKREYGYDLIAEIRFVGEYTEEEKEIWSQFTVH